MSRSFARFVCLCIGIPALGHSAPQERTVPELQALMKQYAADLQFASEAIYQASVSELNRSYAAAVERGLKSAQDGARLEEAVAFKKEAASVSKNEAMPSSDAGLPPALAKLRVVYRQSMARIEQDRINAAAPLTKSLGASLDQLVSSLTRSGRLDDALFVKQKKESLNLGNISAAIASAGQKTFTNTLGMKFVPVKGTKVLFCIHETRRQDYAAFAGAVPDVPEPWKNQQKDGVPCGDKDDHPVCGVSWEDAVKFCEWLGKKEGRKYRLPTDEEWSIAVGLAGAEKHDADTTPEMLSQKEHSQFPWGSAYPPKEKVRAGNYADESWHLKFPKASYIENYDDGHPTTAPVMSFPPNEAGLHDMGGNVWEWVEDWWNATHTERVLRGGSWYYSDRNSLLSSRRNRGKPTARVNQDGFRCVLEEP